MRIIDSDAHVLEIEKTWDYMDPSVRQYRPQLVSETLASGEVSKSWAIDGRSFLAPYPGGGKFSMLGPHSDNVALSDDSKFLLDVQARVHHMDELGTDVQVLYPTIFLSPISEKAEVEHGVRKSYNRWLADVWVESGGRLRWAAVLPLYDMDESLEELRFAVDHGACAIFMRGVELGDRLLIDEYFHPLYNALSELDVPMCVHAGNGSFDIDRIWTPPDATFARAKFPGVSAFHQLLYTGMMAKFPELRVGFVELSAQWLPYVIHDLERRVERRGRVWSDDPLRDNHIWVACQTNDDHQTIMRYVGDDNLVIGTDYGHADTSTEIYALQEFRKNEGLSSDSIRKILDDNPVALYSL